MAAHDRSASRRGGSGLGLSSAASYVAGVGGSLEALSDGVGKGATVRVRLGLSFIWPQRPFGEE